MSNPNRSIFKVYVVDPRGSGTVLLDGKSVVAISEGEAQLKAGVGQIASEKNFDLEQVDIYCEKIAEFIRPRKDKQRVVIAKEGETD
jgi:hypothetical protein